MLPTTLRYPVARASSAAHKIFNRARIAIFRSHSKALSALLLLISVCSCTPTDSFYYRSNDKNLHAIGRVALVELDNDSSYPQISADVSEALFLALQKKQVLLVL